MSRNAAAPGPKKLGKQQKDLVLAQLQANRDTAAQQAEAARDNNMLLTALLTGQAPAAPASMVQPAAVAEQEVATTKKTIKKPKGKSKAKAKSKRAIQDDDDDEPMGDDDEEMGGQQHGVQRRGGESVKD